MKRFLLILCFGSVLAGCFYDKKSELYPASMVSGACDTLSSMSYSTHIAPIISGYCLSCHSGPFPSGGVTLDTYGSVSSYALTGQLSGSIHNIAPYNLMPPTAPLDRCKIRQIDLWISAGAPNN